MAVKIRLKRMGAKKAPFYRVIVADSRSPRDGRFIDTIGTYNPLTTPAEIKLNEESAINIPVDVKHWHGAAPDEWFSHLAIEVPGVDCSNEWCEAVSEKEYKNIKNRCL